MTSVVVVKHIVCLSRSLKQTNTHTQTLRQLSNHLLLLRLVTLSLLPISFFLYCSTRLSKRSPPFLLKFFFWVLTFRNEIKRVVRQNRTERLVLLTLHSNAWKPVLSTLCSGKSKKSQNHCVPIATVINPYKRKSVPQCAFPTTFTTNSVSPSLSLNRKTSQFLKTGDF